MRLLVPFIYTYKTNENNPVSALFFFMFPKDITIANSVTHRHRNPNEFELKERFQFFISSGKFHQWPNGVSSACQINVKWLNNNKFPFRTNAPSTSLSISYQIRIRPTIEGENLSAQM